MVHPCLSIRVLLIIVFVGYAMEQTHHHSGNGSRSGGKVIATSNITDQSSGSLGHVVMQQHSTLHRHDKLMSDMSQYNWSGVKHVPTKGLVMRETHGRGIQGQQQQREHATDFVSVGGISLVDGAGQNGLKMRMKPGGDAAQRQQATIAPSFASIADSLLEHADIVSVAPIKAVTPDASVINNVLAQNSYESKYFGAYTEPLKRSSSNTTQRHRHHRDRATMLSSAGDVIPLDGTEGPARSEPHIFPGPARRGLLRREGKHLHGHPRMREPPQEGQNDSPNMPTSLSVSEQAPTVVPTAAAAMLTLAPQTSSGSSQDESQTASPVTEPAQSADGGSSWTMVVLGVFLGMGASCVAFVLVKRGRFEGALGMQPMPAIIPTSRPNSQNVNPHRWTRFASPGASPESSTTLAEERFGTASGSLPHRFSSFKKSKGSVSIMHGDDSPVISPTTSPRTRVLTRQVSSSNSESNKKKNDSSSSLTLSSETPRTVSPERTNAEGSPRTHRSPRTTPSQSKSNKTILPLRKESFEATF